MGLESPGLICLTQAKKFSEFILEIMCVAGNENLF